jgi:tRNA (cytidine/uridine-2'-O-)-methyltransferase
MDSEEKYPQIVKPVDSNWYAVGLFEPEIPLNVGSIARTCACTGTPLHLIGKLGFRLDDKLARRAGLDYWPLAEVHIHKKWEDFEEAMEGRRIWYLSTKGLKSLWEAQFRAGDVLVFGSEGSGLPGEIMNSGRGEVVRIPMLEERRSLNLSNAVSIALYEALRQAESN